ncbi:MAG: hypothetical protein ONB06_04025, partial [candidate division KSB1 bacterium]|nr:hypothetical protein [candidate division KSB1 bacterium]
MGKLEEMLAARQAPGVITDKRRFGGGKYVASLARFPGDPEAHISSMAEARRVLERRGWYSEDIPGMEVPAPQEPTGQYEPAADIIDRLVEERIAEIGEKSLSDKEKAEI